MAPTNSLYVVIENNSRRGPYSCEYSPSVSTEPIGLFLVQNLVQRISSTSRFTSNVLHWGRTLF